MLSFITAGGGYPSAVVTRAHSSITELTEPREAGAVAISPALARVRVAIAATVAKPNNFTHISAIMLSLIWVGTPPAANACWMSAQRAARVPVNSPKIVV